MKVSLPIRRKRVAEQERENWFQRNSTAILGLTAFALAFVIAVVVLIHFQFGYDIWGISIKNPESAQYWGQIGDFVGGILNPILSFFALIAVLSNLVLQRKELTLARKDAEESHRVQKMQSQTQLKQSKLFEDQNFESVFFRLLDTHSRLASSIRLDIGNGRAIVGVEVFDWVVRKYLPDAALFSTDLAGEIDPKEAWIKQAANNFVDQNSRAVGHYFRNLYQIMKYIDGYGQLAAPLAGLPAHNMYMRRSLKNYVKQRSYANMLRAQLCTSEVTCIFLNCMTPRGDGLKYYVEKYSLLKTIDDSHIWHCSVAKKYYSDIAYADYEELERDDLLSLISQKTP